jgi:hypothetical protein
MLRSGEQKSAPRCFKWVKTKSGRKIRNSGIACLTVAGMLLLTAGQLRNLPLFAAALPSGSLFWMMGPAVIITSVGLSVFQSGGAPAHA